MNNNHAHVSIPKFYDKQILNRNQWIWSIILFGMAVSIEAIISFIHNTSRTITLQDKNSNKTIYGQSIMAGLCLY